MSNITNVVSPIVAIFQSEVAYQIRVLVIDGEPWFAAVDVCNVLDYANGRDAIAKHCRAGGVAKRDTPTNSGIQPLTYINEGNLYRLVIKSRKPEAERFESWVCDEVLPSIRKTGSYALPAARPAVLAELGIKLSQHFIERMGRYYYRSGQSVSALVHGSLRARYGVKNVRDIPYAKLDDVVQFLEHLTGEAYRIWSVCNELENWQLSRAFGVKVGDYAGLSPDMAGYLPAMMDAVEMPQACFREISEVAVKGLISSFSTR